MPSYLAFDFSAIAGDQMATSQFHYVGCGCTVDAPPPPGVSELDRRVWGHQRNNGLVNSALPRVGAECRDPLRVTYLIPHHNVTGGMKMLVGQMEALQQRGHVVQAAFRGPQGSPVMPPWSSCVPNSSVLLDTSQHWSQVLNLLQSDVIVVGFFCQLSEFPADKIAPLLYWEQGHEHIFADGRSPPLLQYDIMFHQLMRMHLVALASVSTVVQRTLERQFGRVSGLVPNGIDCTKFYPHRDALATDSHTNEKRVLIVGNPGHAFKGFDVALQALNIVHRSFPSLVVTWICQVKPTVSGVSFPIRFHVNPPQHDLPAIYRDGKFHAFLFTSRYEAWGMPVLEAFATAIPTVTSQCHGVTMFCRHAFNCMTAPASSPDLLGRHVSLLLSNRDFAAYLAKNARETAEQLTWDKATDALEDALYRCSDSYQRALGLNPLISRIPRIPSSLAPPTTSQTVPSSSPSSTRTLPSTETTLLANSASHILGTAHLSSNTLPSSSAVSAPDPHLHSQMLNAALRRTLGAMMNPSSTSTPHLSAHIGPDAGLRNAMRQVTLTTQPPVGIAAFSGAFVHQGLPTAIRSQDHLLASNQTSLHQSSESSLPTSLFLPSSSLHDSKELLGPPPSTPPRNLDGSAMSLLSPNFSPDFSPNPRRMSISPLHGPTPRQTSPPSLPKLNKAPPS